MAAVDPNKLSKFVGLLYVADYTTGTPTWVRIASVRGLVANIDAAANLVEVKADDTGTVFKGLKPEVRIEGEFLENIDRDLLSQLLGGTTNDVAGTPVVGATQVYTAGEWAVNTLYPFDNQNGDGTVPTVASVVGSVDGAFLANDDYDLVVDDNGLWGIVFQDLGSSTTSTTLTQTVTITYGYTPNAAEEFTLPIEFMESPRLMVKIEATNDAGDIRRITLDDCTFEGTYGMSFLDVVEAGDITGTQFVFKATDGSNLDIHNEILT